MAKNFFSIQGTREFRNLEGLVRDLISGTVEEIKETTDAHADILSKSIRKSYESQSLPGGGFPSSYNLSEDYRIKKIKEGLDPRIGIKHAKMINAIKSVRRSGSRWFVGVSKGVGAHKKGSLKIAQYTRILEFGSHNQKARPVFVPNFRAWVPKYKIAAINRVKKRIKNVLRRYV